MSDRARSLALAAALVVCLVAGSPPRIVGDGGEYMAQAMNFASFNRPALGRRAILDIEPRIRSVEPALAEWSIEAASVPSADRRRDFLHFWFYALLATPALWVVDAVGVSPIHAFTLTNSALLGAAIWILVPRIGRAATLLLLGGPLIWWIDKPHTEPFTVALLAIALALCRERPAPAMIAAGMAATQNLPVGVVYALIVGAGLVRTRGGVLRDRAWLTGAAIGGGLALLHPVYSYVRHGTPSLLLYATRPGFPTTAELSAVVFDPTIGLVGNAPFFLVGTVLAAGMAARQNIRALATIEAGIASATALVFLYAAAETANSHHGATPSLSRYALWLMPLAVPLFAAARTGSRLARAAIPAVALASSLTSVFAFHPGVPQLGREPTWLATWLWTRHPTWQNPLPEVFSEIMTGTEGTTVPAATARCEKVLLAAGEPADGLWPVPCYPAELAGQCGGRERLCYANRIGSTYRFLRAPGREGPPRHDRRTAWPLLSEPHVRSIYDAWDWWELSARAPNIQVLRASVDVRTAEFGTDDRFLVVMRRTGPNALVRLRPGPGRLAGRLYDPLTGERLQELSYAGAPGELWSIDLPADRDLALLALTTGDVPE